MKVSCPNDASHKDFYVTAHVAEEWVVDDMGLFQCVAEGSSSEVVHAPDSQDLYTCRYCGCEAKVVA